MFFVTLAMPRIAVVSEKLQCHWPFRLMTARALFAVTATIGSLRLRASAVRTDGNIHLGHITDGDQLLGLEAGSYVDLKLLYGGKCISMNSVGGFTSYSDPNVHSQSCTGFFPVATSQGSGILMDTISHQCLGWAYRAGASDVQVIPNVQGFVTTNCVENGRIKSINSGQSGITIYTTFVQDGPRFCVIGDNGQKSEVCLDFVDGAVTQAEPMDVDEVSDIPMDVDEVSGKNHASANFVGTMTKAVPLGLNNLCVIANPSGGFISHVDATVNPAQCSGFEPMTTFAGVGMFRDRLSHFCLGWAGSTQSAGLNGFGTSPCNEWQNGEHVVLQQFMNMGGKKYCLQGLNGQITKICLHTV